MRARLPANLFRPLPDARDAEQFTTLLARPGVQIERIVTHGQITPIEAPYEQAHDEWVLLLAGAARLWCEGSGEVELAPGDHLLIPAQVRHRVTWTPPDRETIWLALHFTDQG